MRTAIFKANTNTDGKEPAQGNEDEFLVTHAVQGQSSLVELSHVPADPERFIRVGELTVDRRTGVVEADGLRRKLRRKEIELLTYLFRCGSRPVRRQQILQDVWRCPNMITRTVDQTVATLRRKLREDSENPKHLVTIHGVGYQLMSPG